MRGNAPNRGNLLSAGCAEKGSSCIYRPTSAKRARYMTSLASEVTKKQRGAKNHVDKSGKCDLFKRAGPPCGRIVHRPQKTSAAVWLKPGSFEVLQIGHCNMSSLVPPRLMIMPNYYSASGCRFGVQKGRRISRPPQADRPVWLRAKAPKIVCRVSKDIRNERRRGSERPNRRISRYGDGDRFEAHGLVQRGGRRYSRRGMNVRIWLWRCKSPFKGFRLDSSEVKGAYQVEN